MALAFFPWHVRWRRRLRSLLWTSMLIAVLALLWWTNRPPQHSGTMLFASDGDSFTLTTDRAPMRLRLIGIDAPELGQLCHDARGQTWTCGTRARDTLKALAARDAALQCTTTGKDRHDRGLSRCQFTDGRDLAAKLVETGLAIATDEDYLREQEAARRAKAGIWQGDFQTPAEWRTANPRSNAAMLPPS